MLVAFEGIDGAGKTTQVQLLKERAHGLGMQAEILSFPRYNETVFARCIAAYLNGQFGDLAAVPPASAALLYAGDRFESLSKITAMAQANDLLILDRYVASNLAHQGARVPPAARQNFLDWVAGIEYTAFGLPKADITVYLDMPVHLASELIHKRKQRSYTASAADIHEADTAYLAQCREIYQMLVEQHTDSAWFMIPCAYPDDELRGVMEIHEAIWNAIQDVVCRSEIGP